MPRLSRFFGIDIYMPSRESNHPYPIFTPSMRVKQFPLQSGRLRFSQGRSQRRNWQWYAAGHLSIAPSLHAHGKN